MACGCLLCPKRVSNPQVRASLMAALLFFIVASPRLFALMQQVLGGLVRIAAPGGSPTLAGLLVHAAVYGLVVYALMRREDRRRWH